MELLDDLSLTRILEFLGLPDQIAMLQAYESCRPLLGSIWRRRLTGIELNLLEVPVNGGDFQFLLASASRRLNELRLSYLDREHFEALVGLRFPNLRLLQVDPLPPFAMCPRQRHQLRQVLSKSSCPGDAPTMGYMLLHPSHSQGVCGHSME